MANDKTKTRPQDSSRVNVNEDYEVRYWTEKWKVTRDQLRAAVRKAGVSVEAVARALGKKP